MINLLFSIENILHHHILTLSRRWLPEVTQGRLRLLLVMGLLLLSIVLPLKVSPLQFFLLLSLFIAGGAALVFIRWPVFGLVSVIISGLFAPSLGLPGGLNPAVLLLLLLICLWLLDMTLSRYRSRFVSSRTFGPLLGLVFIACLSFGIGQLPWFPFAQHAPLDSQLGGLAIFVLAPGIFLMVAHQVRDLRWLQRLTWLFVVLGFFFVAGWIGSPIGISMGKLYHIDATANAMFWTWLVALAFSQALINKRLSLVWRLVLGAVVLATVYVALFLNYQWKSGWIPVLVTIAAIIGFRYWRAGLVLAPVGAFLVIPAVVSQAIETEGYSFGTRMDAWLIMLEIIEVNPLLGLGPANYRLYTPLYAIRGYFVEFNSHNQYLDIVAQIGLLGLACFLWFAWEAGWLGWRLRTRVPEGFAQAYVYGALGGLVGTLVAGMLVDWIFPFVYNIGLEGFRTSLLPWLYLGGLVSIEQIVKRQKLT